ncbi:MAG: Uma2 family endonuclease [Nitrospirales bacterium]|nr:Uma2 family endonuclease [Nitrospirales bacterium]
MGHPVIKPAEKYTWQDYLTWPDNERWEVIDGVAYNMSPSPSERHQTITLNFAFQLKGCLKETQCRTYVAPLDVYYDDENFVQPDVFVVCDKNKIKDRIYGAPDLIIEVISPSTSLKDKREKKRLYERFGVKEYVIIHPEEVFAERYCLRNNAYGEAEVFGPYESLPLCSLEGIEIPLWEVFGLELPERQEL